MLWNSQTGWIGIDVGACAVKVAQVERCRGRWRLVEGAIVRRDEPWPARAELFDEPLSSGNEMITARSLAARLRGRAAAAVCSMSVCESHAVQLPEEIPFSLAAVAEELERAALAPEREMTFDCWPTRERTRGAVTEPESVAVVSMPATWSDACADDVQLAGWSCQALGALPLALAQAASMSPNYPNDATCALLDWGYENATLCAVQHGTPLYVRRLKNVGMRRVLEALMAGAGLTRSEAGTVLAGQLPGTAPGESREVASLVGELAAACFEDLEEEIRRTFRHLGNLSATLVPKHLELFGGGARVPGAEARLSRTLRLPVAAWRPDPALFECRDFPAERLPELAPAIAMSLARWEAV